MSHVEPYALTMSEVAQSGRSCVLIDDSGTPGQIAGSKYLDPNRKTWVAVLISHLQIREVCDQFPGALDKLTTLTRATEFHFMEAYRGSGQFKSVAFKVRLALFEFMRNIFVHYMFPVIVQTFDPHDLSEIRGRAKLPEKIGPFVISSPSDAALFFLLIQVKKYLEQHPRDFATPSFVVLDEGFRPADRSIKIPTWDEVFHNSSIYTTRSKSFLLIQLADYAAFCVGRTQWLLTKEKLSRSDKAFLPMIADIRLNTVNLTERNVNFRDWQLHDYGRMIERDRQRKGLSPKHKQDTQSPTTD